MASIKLFIFFACLVGFASAQFGLPSPSDSIPLARQVLNRLIPEIRLLEYNNVPTKEGYRFNYKTDDGTYREEVGMIMNPGTDDEELVVMGAFSYVDDDDVETVTMYTADRNGYRPRVQLKNRGIQPKLLKNLVHNG